ncbi:succinylglutamate desuccinylase/aspartoacylase family protein [Pseudogulbenkiania sp. NH8B]|uniref:succinylglutamate desuccinylase/aspartoacylase family protein n=1 Tax=Pseudogulbenkiania sp. (strain NH8B) TaxID=748280 RepID=UPI00022798D5|nr:succinylglutamate desuccinylase/aspartoacylase family protein [Pseudogulbenkiania sp. NH8B]BAK76797.1 succinylglutamate desuccinylase/aspartoacylase family protein [Pseudogulbenkiania sp. NH8B]
MKQYQHPLQGMSLGSQRHISSFHYGDSSQGQPRAYIQAGLHASEIPGMLVAHYLREKLQLLEDSGQLTGEVIVVPVANPVGLDQTVLSYQMGRFDFATGQNFNRLFPSLAESVAQDVADQQRGSPQENVQLIRRALQRQLAKFKTVRTVDSLRTTLLALSCGCDLVLDLHCDCESVLHLYTHPAFLDAIMPLSALLGAHATLYAEIQGGSPFDEAHVEFWTRLKTLLPQHDIPLATTTATIELRGQLDVGHQQAEVDADAIIEYLRLSGYCEGGKAVEVPFPSHKPTPLAGTEVIVAEKAGVITYVAECGKYLQLGEPVVDVVDPISGETIRYVATTAGVMFARQNRRYAMPGMDLAYIAGKIPLRTGELLSM